MQLCVLDAPLVDDLRVARIGDVDDIEAELRIENAAGVHIGPRQLLLDLYIRATQRQTFREGHVSDHLQVRRSARLRRLLGINRRRRPQPN